MQDSSKKYLSWELIEPLLVKLKPVKGEIVVVIAGNKTVRLKPACHPSPSLAGRDLPAPKEPIG